MKCKKRLRFWPVAARKTLSTSPSNSLAKCFALLGLVTRMSRPPFATDEPWTSGVKWLPPKVETIQRVALTGKQADLYETIRLTTEATVREALQELASSP